MRDLEIIGGAHGPAVMQEIFNAVVDQVSVEVGASLGDNRYRQKLSIDGTDHIWYIEFRHDFGGLYGHTVIEEVYGVQGVIDRVASSPWGGFSPPGFPPIGPPPGSYRF